MDKSRLQPALYGGLVIGVLSALPIVNAGNCCCCLWVIAGGALATYLLQQNTPYQVTAADGALVGLLAGLIGGVVAGILSIPLHAVTAGFMRQIMERIIANNPDFPPEARDALERFGMASGAGLVISALFNIVISTVFGLLGGLLGVAIFKKKDLPPPPPPGTIDVPSAPAQ
ncbi:MAG: hypothetical protein A3H96_16470 [Acidobacteria bacterium RIFCSPLOWO2_02_FULL_67_36]|nr:MAG: hypothetical protein A3H96_16470 [Acidobacteria bacterium RIFCSPLOWO2_02_FULL_67_36]OFW20758.1 MAG: hypothetical protein A3G21_22670 [Acidobacteria bacterium RIFCSPLOWO2_12_FULL_66_21]